MRRLLRLRRDLGLGGFLLCCCVGLRGFLLRRRARLNRPLLSGLAGLLLQRCCVGLHGFLLRRRASLSGLLLRGLTGLLLLHLRRRTRLRLMLLCRPLCR